MGIEGAEVRQLDVNHRHGQQRRRQQPGRRAEQPSGQEKAEEHGHRVHQGRKRPPHQQEVVVGTASRQIQQIGEQAGRQAAEALPRRIQSRAGRGQQVERQVAVGERTRLALRRPDAGGVDPGRPVVGIERAAPRVEGRREVGRPGDAGGHPDDVALIRVGVSQGVPVQMLEAQPGSKNEDKRKAGGPEQGQSWIRRALLALAVGVHARGPRPYSSSSRNTAIKASWGTSTFPTIFIRRFPRFWRDKRAFFRLTSPP